MKILAGSEATDGSAYEHISSLRVEPLNSFLWMSGTAYIVGGLVVGAGLLMSSYTLTGIGLLPSLLGLYGLHQAFRQVGGKGQHGAWQSRRAVVGVTAFVIGGVLILAGVKVGLGRLVFLGTWLAAVALAEIAALFRIATKRGPEQERRAHEQNATWWMVGGLLVVTATIVLVLVFDSDEVVVASLLVGVLGLIATTIGLMRLTLAEPRVWSAVGFGLVLGSIVALVIWRFVVSNPVLLLLSLSAFGLGLVSTSKGLPVLATDWPRFPRWIFFALGLACAAIATVMSSSAAWSVWWALGVVILALLLAMALVGNVIELAVFLLIGVAMTAVVAERTVGDSLSPHPEAAERIVALGDSYIAGEGANRFFPGTNVADENQCRRSSTAYPYLVANELGMGLDFLACSGARIRHLDTEGQQPMSPPEVVGGLPQLDSLTLDGPNIAAVLVSIGGNDAWFGKVGQACFAPGSCALHRTTVLRRVLAIGFQLEDVYNSIIDRVGRGTPIIVMPYPMGMTPVGCDASPLTEAEHEFLFEYAEVLNDLARTKAERVGIHFFEPGMGAFNDSRVCEVATSEAAINVVDLNPTEGSLVDRLAPVNWTHGSAHPNATGHVLTAKALTPWLRDLLTEIRTGTQPPNPEPNPDAQFELTQPAPFRRVSTSNLSLGPGVDCPTEELPISALKTVAVPGVTRRFTDLEPGSLVCHNPPDGEWINDRASEDGTAAVETWSAELLASDEAQEAAQQVIITKDKGGKWRIAVLGFCELDPACAEDDDAIDAWTYSQIRDTAESSLVPVSLIFVGAWFVAIEIRVRQLKLAAKEGADASD